MYTSIGESFAINPCDSRVDKLSGDHVMIFMIGHPTPKLMSKNMVNMALHVMALELDSVLLG